MHASRFRFAKLNQRLIVAYIIGPQDVQDIAKYSLCFGKDARVMVRRSDDVAMRESVQKAKYSRLRRLIAIDLVQFLLQLS